MPLRIRSWGTFQAGAIGNIVRSRNKQNGKRLATGLPPLSLDRPYTMDKMLVARTFDGHFAHFATLVGARNGERFWLRTLQAAANGGGLTGVIPTSREDFGFEVLSRLTRPRDMVSVKMGKKVYDALIESGLACALPGEVPGALPGDLPSSDPVDHPGGPPVLSPSPSPSPSPSGGNPGDESGRRGSGPGGEGQPRPMGNALAQTLATIGIPELEPNLTDDELRAQQDHFVKIKATPPEGDNGV